jgi:GH35 family endo-1,4-beta-xylanase
LFRIENEHIANFKNHTMKNIGFSLLLFLSPLLAFSQTPLGKCKGKYMGNIIQSSTTSGAGLNYNNYWNQATSENGSKWGSVETSQNTYNWSNSDIAYNWAKANGGLFKYHNFVWGSQTPAYVATASIATLTASVENYIKACSTHYAPMGGIKLIDVVNEPIKTALPGNYKAALTAGYQADPANAADKNNQYGWIIWPYQLARKYFPNATLLINEYSIENDPNGALVTYAAMVNAVKNAPNLTDGTKNLIDGIGLQCHAFSFQNNGVQTLSAASFKASLDKLYSLTGLPMHITEFDADANANETTQKNVFQSLITVAWEHPNVAGITFWGYVQGYTWRNGNGVTGATGTDSGIILADGTERPAMTWLKSYMATMASLSCCPAPAPMGSCAVTCSTPLAPTVTTPVNYCMGDQATALTASGTSLNWYTVATGGTASSTSPVPTTTVPGVQNFWVSQSSGTCESPRAQITVNVNQVPAAPTVTSPVTYCVGDPSKPLVANGNFLKWYTAPSGGTSSAATPVPTTTNAGTQNFWVSQTLGSCESKRAQITVTVNAAPLPPTVTSPVGYCVGDAATALTANGTSLKWYTVSTGGTSSTTNPTPTTTAAGTQNFWVTQTSNTCESPRSQITVNINPAPAVTITAGGPTTFPPGGSVLLSANTGNGLTYIWTLGTSTVGTSSTYTANTSGSYKVEVKNNFACKTLSAPVTVTVSGTVTGIDDSNINASVLVYPNPFISGFEIKSKEPILYRITDIKGAEIVTGSTEEGMVLGNALNPGFYFLMLKVQEQNKLIKLVKIN